MKKFKVVTLGCKVNSYESEAISNMFIAKGYERSENEADIIVINTCSVTSTSDSKSRQRIRREIKENPNAIVCVMGCYSQVKSDEVKNIEGVSIVIGTKYRNRVVDLVEQYEVNKKQIVMRALSLVVCVAVFLNWKFLQTDSITDDVSVSNEQSNDEQTDGEEVKKLGEAQYVSSVVEDTNEYFTGSRLTRQQSKDKAIELLESVIENEASSAASIEKANAEITEIATQTELEGKIESLIKAKGFEDCVVFLGSETANVVVRSDGLSAVQAAQINEIVVSETEVSAQKIKIVEVK